MNEDKNVCIKINEAKLTSKFSYQISVTVIDTATSNVGGKAKINRGSWKRSMYFTENKSIIYQRRW